MCSPQFVLEKEGEAEICKIEEICEGNIFGESANSHFRLKFLVSPHHSKLHPLSKTLTHILSFLNFM